MQAAGCQRPPSPQDPFKHGQTVNSIFASSVFFTAAEQHNQLLNCFPVNRQPPHRQNEACLSAHFNLPQLLKASTHTAQRSPFSLATPAGSSSPCWPLRYGRSSGLTGLLGDTFKRCTTSPFRNSEEDGNERLRSDPSGRAGGAPSSPVVLCG